MNLMKLQFKIFTIFLFISTIIFGQEKILYSKNYKTNEVTTALLEFNIGGGIIEIEESNDDKFYIEHSIEFENYSKRQKEKITKEIQNRYSVATQIKGNHISYSYKNKSNIRSYYNIDSYMNSGYIPVKKNDSLIKHKQIKTFIDEVKENKTSEFFFINSITKTKHISERRKERTIKKHKNKNTKSKIYRLNVKFKIPKNLNLTINSDFTRIKFIGNLKNKFSIRFNGGRLFADSFKNKDNVIKLKDGIIIIESMSGGELSLDSVRHALLGELSNLKLNSEFSKIEIGEISSNTKMEGFNNSMIIHNFSTDFNNLEIESEYSDINMFYPQINNFTLKTFGNNTVHYIDGERKTYKNKETEIIKMFELIKNENSSNSNKIKITSLNSIIRLGKNIIDFGS
mgnify:CR=1 FL=1